MTAAQVPGPSPEEVRQLGEPTAADAGLLSGIRRFAAAAGVPAGEWVRRLVTEELLRRMRPPAYPGERHAGWWCQHVTVRGDLPGAAPCPQGCKMIPMYKRDGEGGRKSPSVRNPGSDDWRERAAEEKQRLLWGCRCGKGGSARTREETERQVAGHLSEELGVSDWLHVVHVGTFAESFFLAPPAPGQDGPPELMWREAGSEPDLFGPHPRLGRQDSGGTEALDA